MKGFFPSHHGRVRKHLVQLKVSLQFKKKKMEKEEEDDEEEETEQKDKTVH